MERHEDPNDPLNSARYHTGKPCIELGCGRPAGTHWSKLWCQSCNSARINRINGVLEHLLARLECRDPENIMPPNQ